MTDIKLGINTGFAVNRYPEPEVWLNIVRKDLGLHYVQYVADLVEPTLPEDIQMEGLRTIKRLSDEYKIKIDTAFTYSRRPYLMDYSEKIREENFKWLSTFLHQSSILGVRGVGSHFGIMSIKDYNTPDRRRYILNEAIKYWQRLSECGKEKGLKFLMFEPMSIPREMAETIDKTKKLWEQVNEKSSIPIMLCLDVGHGSINSGNPKDSDPYGWLKELAYISPVIHIYQTDSVRNVRHWPFTEEYNRLGIIEPLSVLEAIRASGAKSVVLLLEITHPERYPAEGKVLDDLKDSVEYWRRYVWE